MTKEKGPSVGELIRRVPQTKAQEVHDPPADRSSSIAFIAKAMADRAVDDLLERTQLFQSPIEESFFYALIAESWEAGLAPAIVSAKCPRLVLDAFRELDEVEICPQAAVGAMHPDFVLRGKYFAAITPGEPKWVTSEFAIECDGHDFHERTKSQATRDKRRDRELATHGMTVARFTGSEIHSDARKCAAWTLEHLKHLAWRPEIEAQLRGDPALHGWAIRSALRKDRRGADPLIGLTGWGLADWMKRTGFKPSEG